MYKMKEKEKLSCQSKSEFPLSHEFALFAQASR